MTVLVSVLLYLPSVIISGPGAIIANRFVSSLPVEKVIADLPGEIAKTISHWLRDTSRLGQVLILLGLSGSLLAFTRRRNIFYLLPIVGPLLLVIAVIAHRVVPFPRVWLFLLPLLMICVAAGLCEIANRLAGSATAKRKIALAALLIAVVAAGVSSAFMSTKRDYLISEDPKTFVDAEPIIDDAIALAGAKTTFLWDWDDPHWPPLAYYLAIKSYQRPELDDFARQQPPRTIVIVASDGSLGSVFKSNPGSFERMAKVELLKRYPSGATVFLADFRPAGQNR